MHVIVFFLFVCVCVSKAMFFYSYSIHHIRMLSLSVLYLASCPGLCTWVRGCIVSGMHVIVFFLLVCMYLKHYILHFTLVSIVTGG